MVEAFDPSQQLRQVDLQFKANLVYSEFHWLGLCGDSAPKGEGGGAFKKS